MKFQAEREISNCVIVHSFIKHMNAMCSII